MRKPLLAVALLILGFFVLRAVACTAGSAPDDKLADHLDAMCRIAEKGAKSPDDGVQRLFGYFGENGPTMLHQLGDLLVTIERIDDDARHDQRARVARDRLRARVISCAATWERFSEAIERDERARRRFERGMERFGRTIEIIFGQSAADFPLLRYARDGWK